MSILAVQRKSTASYGTSGLARGHQGVRAREAYEKEFQALKSERDRGWVDIWFDIAEALLPKRPRFLVTDRTPDKRADRIINNTPGAALEILQAGMMGGLTTPSRPWYKLQLPGLGLSKSSESYLYRLEQQSHAALLRTNIYSQLTVGYGDLGAFGVYAMLTETSPKHLLRGYIHPIGSFVLGCNAENEVHIFAREWLWTVENVIGRFGYDACSLAVRSAWDRRDYHQKVHVVHMIRPRRERNPRAMDQLNMPFESCFFELGCPEDKILQEGGYRRFPVIAPRWSTTGEDVYGYGPGEKNLGDIRGLQQLERRKLRAVDKQVTPPVQAPAALKGRDPISQVPGGVTYADWTAAGQKIEPLHIPDVRLDHLHNEIERHEARCWNGFFANVFMLVSATTEQGPQRTAEEIRAIAEERLLQLGPVLHNLHGEQNTPLVGRVIDAMAERGELEDMPPELQDHEYEIEEISILSVAQKAVSARDLERATVFVTSQAAIPGKETVVDVYDADEAVREYLRLIPVSPKLTVDPKIVDGIRAARERQARAQMVAEAAPAAKDYSTAAANIAGIDGGQEALQGVGDAIAGGAA